MQVLLLAAVLLGAHAQNCVFNGVDFSELTKLAGDTDYSGTDSDGNEYFFNVCANTVSSLCGNSAMAYQRPTLACVTLADASPASSVNKQGDELVVTFDKGGEECGGGSITREWRVLFSCGNSLAPSSFTVDEVEVCKYEVLFPTSVACPIFSGSDGGLSGGSVFLIIFFVGFFVYLAGGVAYKVKRFGASGTEAVPNIEFWRELPGLVRDGCSFTANKARGQPGGGSSYSNVG